MGITDLGGKIIDHLLEREVFLGGFAGFMGGIVTGAWKHYPEYEQIILRKADLPTRVGIDYLYYVHQIDEIALGTVLGLAVGSTVKYLCSRRE